VIGNFILFCVTQVDNEQLNLEGADIESMDATKLSRFIHINSLRFVTEYNAMVNNIPVASPHFPESGTQQRFSPP
jgi:hypothetical protein